MVHLGFQGDECSISNRTLFSSAILRTSGKREEEIEDNGLRDTKWCHSLKWRIPPAYFYHHDYLKVLRMSLTVVSRERLVKHLTCFCFASQWLVRNRAHNVKYISTTALHKFLRVLLKSVVKCSCFFTSLCWKKNNKESCIGDEVLNFRSPAID